MPALSGVSKRLLLHCCWLLAKGEFGYGFHYHLQYTHIHTYTRLMSIHEHSFKNVFLCCSHLFAIANLSYTTMMDAKKDQCIVIRYEIAVRHFSLWLSKALNVLLFQLAAHGQN